MPRAPTLSAVVLIALMIGPIAVVSDHGPSTAPTATAAAVQQVAPATSGSNTPWPTYMADLGRTGANHLEHSIAPANVSELRPLWSIPTNGSDFSAPIVADGTVFFGSWNGFEYAVNETTGNLEWQRFLGIDDCGGYSPMGISSTATYDNGSLYLGGGNGTWEALNATTGAVEWGFFAGSTADNFYDWASALVYHGSLYIGLASCFDNPLVAAGLLEVNLSTHRLVTEFNSTPPGQVGESIWTTPAVDPSTNTVWVSTGNENPPDYPIYANAIVGLNATTLNVSGSWQVPNVVGQDADFGSTPTLFHTASNTPMIVATNKNGVAFALDRSNVSAAPSWGPVWNLSTGGGFSGGAFDGASLYLAGSSSIYAVDPANGSTLWSAGMDGGGTIYGSLSWSNGLVYAGGGSEVEAIDAANGTVLWNASLPGGQQTVTEPVVANGRLFVASGDYGSQGYLSAYGLPASTPYSVRFAEQGIPLGKTWSVSLGGVTHVSTSNSTSFAEPNGTVAYLAQGLKGLQVSGLPASGTLTVAGANLTVNLTFIHGATTSFTFHRAGLPNGMSWCASLGGWSGCPDRAGTVLKNLTPGTYSYSVWPEPGYRASAKLHGVVVPVAGSLNLSARGATLLTTFAQVTYAVTFHESGLAPGTRWSVKVVGLFHGHRASVQAHSSTSNITVETPNGTFNYTIGALSHYATNRTGSFGVDALSLTVNVTYSPARPMQPGPAISAGPLRTASSSAPPILGGDAPGAVRSAGRAGEA